MKNRIENKILLGIVVVVALITAAYFLLIRNNIPVDKVYPSGDTPFEAIYEIEGSGVKISKDNTGAVRYFGNDAKGDLTGDYYEDNAFLIISETGGSGIFYYVAVAIKTDTGYLGTNAQLLGDRVAPQTTEIRDGYLIVNYAERLPDEPMTARPSVGVSKYYIVKNNRLIEVSKPTEF